MTAPRVCAVRQAQDLPLLAVEPCGCDPVQVRRCAEEKRRDDYYFNIAGHAAQVLELHAAAGDFLKNLDDRVPAVTWDVAGHDTPFLRRSHRPELPRRRPNAFCGMGLPIAGTGDGMRPNIDLSADWATAVSRLAVLSGLVAGA